ncbi:hypothetical protein FSP39_013603 [Pinctada imbricata]|uniref:Uncharacterized protein n=1 Tax=Pinctada imbricata TaxID=66713 RepID=A0AA88YCH5_PINIB|nr:hypothetical protein FSP39_013603 [Pinctada imbricata]
MDSLYGTSKNSTLTVTTGLHHMPFSKPRQRRHDYESWSDSSDECTHKLASASRTQAVFRDRWATGQVGGLCVRNQDNNTICINVADGHVVMIMLFWLMSITCSGPCPDNIMHEVWTCLNNLTRGGDSLMNGGDAQLMYENCQHGGFNDSLKCLRRVYDTCSDPRKKEAFFKYASIDAWESGFRRFCHNINLYMDKQECITRQSEDIKSCIEKNKDKYLDKPASVSSSDTYQSADQQLSIHNTCTFFHVTQFCYGQPIGAQCGADIRAILSDFTGGITPPMCRNYKVDDRGNSACGHHHHLVLLLFCIISYFLVCR